MTRWLGEWDLIPGLSHYDQGDPAKNGTYRISRDGEKVVCCVDWHDNRQDNSLTYGAIPDGSQTVTDFPGLDTFSLSAVSDNQLDSDAMTGGNVVAKATRRVSGDGKLMSIWMSNSDEQSGWINVFQVYRRTDG